MSLLRSLTRFGQRLLNIQRFDDAHSTVGRARICRVEQFEPRMVMSASAPQIIVGGTEYEQAAGNDTQPNVFVVTFEGGAAGTQLTHLEINGSKSGGPLTFNDAIFDTAPGGLGAYGNHPIQIISHDGFQVLDSSAGDGSTLLSMDFSGFTAGMKLVFTVDVDQVIFIDPTTNEVDVDAVDEGAEFQRSHLTTTFTAPHYQSATVSTQYWDVFDANVATAEQQAGESIDLPNDAYTNTEAMTSLTGADGPGANEPLLEDVSDMTAGAVGVLAQIPLPADLAGKVYEDHNLNNQIDNGDQGVANVSLELWQWNGSTFVDTGKSTTTDSQGNYKFSNLLPGSYQVVKTNPAGYFSVGATAGNVSGTIDAQVSTPDVITQITLQGGDDSEGNNFALAVPATLSGFVYHDKNDDGKREAGEPGIGGVTLSVVPVNVIGTPPAPIQVVTKADGSYSVGGLNPGVWKVVEVTQPAGYLDGLASAGTLGGTAINPGDQIINIPLGDGQSGQEYDFGKLLPNSISGRVVSTTFQDCADDPNPTPIAGVTINLLNSSQQIIETTKTDANGNYMFTALPPGTYSVAEVQPAGYLEGDSDVGSVGGVSVNPDLISTISLISDIHGVNYNFCEHPYSSLSGSVHIDPTGNGQNDTSDPPLAGATVQLLDADGNVLQTTQTDANGNYAFNTLTPGTYGVRELSENGYYFETAFAGTVGGTVPDNHDVGQIALPLATDAKQYNFYVVPPDTLAGSVHVDTNGDGQNNTSDPPLAGVTIQLLDSGGNVLQSTTTDANGNYSFSQLAPGNYGVRELQPNGYYFEAAFPGSVGGTAADNHDINQIPLSLAVNAKQYNFYVVPPGSISGVVHIDVDGDCETNPNEPTLAGVTIQLLDANGNVLQTTQTDANGAYTFDKLPAGVYSVRELQPAGYYFDDAHSGSVGGTVADDHDVTQISLPKATNAIDYNFCVIPPGSISGRVHNDIDGNCETNPNEPGLAGVTVQLLDSSGNVLQTTVTDDKGDYSFQQLPPATYTVHVIQPAGFTAEDSDPGSIGGTSVDANTIGSIVLDAGVNGVNYNFCELKPASLTGKVMISTTPDCAGQFNLPGVAGVTVELFDSKGNLVATTLTDANGNYGFSNLKIDTYKVVDIQPQGYFAVTAAAGDAGGTVVDAHDITQVSLGSGQAAMCYDFYVTPPASISGTVFQDGPPILLIGSQTVDVPAVRDGILRPGDPRIAGVTLELRDGVTGQPILGSQALDGYYAANSPITVKTDSSGNYTFAGLPAGNYAVFEIKPGGFLDGITRAGSTGGVVIGPYSQTDPAVLQGLSVATPNDAILEITVVADESSVNNNFSVVATNPFIYIPPTGPPTPPSAAADMYPVALNPQINNPQPLTLTPPGYYSGSTAVTGFTWHLSVIDAGAPREPGDEQPLVKLTAAEADELAWQTGMEESEWTLAPNAKQRGGESRRLLFGMRGATPVAGDFNGDGVTDLGVFKNGQWFIDVNGNGVWDEGDLWAKLGYDGDKPVVGDWDGDGKDDIGIYGKAWAGDPHAIAQEPGLPDSNNRHTDVPKNVPPQPQQAALGKRSLKRTAQGETRADLIDHVFHYGTPRDIPIVGDFNGDGTDTIGVFSAGTWYEDVDGDGKWTKADKSVKFGEPGDIPVVGDFNGDGVDEVGVYRGGTFILDTNGNGKIDGGDEAIQLGEAGDVPVVGDWDGDGREEVGVYRDGEIAHATARKAG